MVDLIKGIDISTMQGTVDFAACAAEGIQFVICRCGVGNGGKDSNYDKNVAAATAAGLKVAAYHFIYPLPTIPSQPLRDPVKQAQLHAGWAGTSPVPVICCDMEWPLQQDWAKWGCTAAQIVQWTITYLQAYEAATGIRPVVYTFPYFAEALNLPQSFAQTYQLWIASYEPTPAVPAPWTSWVLWQDTGGTQKLPNGVPVDTNKAVDLSLWSVQSVVVAPAPVPPVVVDPVPLVTAPVTIATPAPTPIINSPSSSNIFVSIWNALSAFFK
jgi:lysozyme